MGLKPPYFHPRSKRLVPCGELRAYSTKAEYKDGLGVWITCVWIDEAGFLWEIDHATPEWELRPKNWPLTVHATYVLKHQMGSTPVVANSLDEAVELLRAHQEKQAIYFDRSRVSLLSVTGA